MIPPKELALAYLTHYRTKDESLFWAWESVDAAVRQLSSGLPTCLELIEASESEAELAYIAAGPLEDLLNRLGEPAAAALELPARRSEKVRKALEAVWLRPESAAYATWHDLVDCNV